MSELVENNNEFISEVLQLVRKSRNKVAGLVNVELTMLYWNIGSKINQVVLNNNRAEYGKQVIEKLSNALTQEFGKGWSVRHIWNCIDFVKCFSDLQILHTLCAELSWSHFRLLCSIDDELKRLFYAQLSKSSRWSVRELERQTDAMLYERTAIAQKPDELIRNELEKLSNDATLNPDLVFKNSYVLDFLGLSANHSEDELENAVIQQLQNFILELGNGFAFIEQQKRMMVDGTDYYHDLLFYHRKLRCLVAIDLKLGKFKPQHKGQMELYLRWLERNEQQEHENPPIGLLLCAEGNTEHIEMMLLNQTEIRVAQYLTSLPTKEWFVQKLHRAIQIAEQNTISKKI